MSINAPDDLSEVHEINVTPFIDVILVLLIIFMVAAPLSTVDAPVDLPSSNAAPVPRPEAPVWLTANADGGLVLNEDPITIATLAPALEAVTGGDRETRILLRADRALSYGDLTEVMNALRAAGWLKIGLVGSEAVGSAEAAAPVPAAAPAPAPAAAPDAAPTAAPAP